jgi:hypothetical protein
MHRVHVSLETPISGRIERRFDLTGVR